MADKKREANGDSDLAQAMLNEHGDAPLGKCIQYNDQGVAIYVPPYIQEIRAKRAADALLKKTT